MACGKADPRWAHRVVAGLAVVLLGVLPAYSREQGWSLDLSGQLRERFESVDNPVFGLPSSFHDSYVLHRLAVSAELSHGPAFRSVLGIVSGGVSGESTPPAATQRDSVDILQAYVEPSVPVGSGRLALRLGRQEAWFGAARLVSVRESPNIRRAFDGARLDWATALGPSVSVFWLRPVVPRRDAFDDRSTPAERFWGLHASWPATGFEDLAFDTYYLGLNRRTSAFAQGIARERRHTLGTRAYGEHRGWDWNIEAAWQWGWFGATRIRAWTVSLDAGYVFTRLPLKPRVGLKMDAISGDGDAKDRRLGTFNPLYPKLPYFSEANLATPANLLDIQPNIRLSPAERLSVDLSWNGLWKYHAADAFYAPLLSPVQGTENTRSREIGWQASAQIQWEASRNLELGTTYVRFEPGSAIRQAGGRAGNFLTTWIRWTP